MASERCPVCGRAMAAPAGRALVTSLAGSKEVEVCAVCVVLWPMDSIVTAALEGAC
jgi:hypothetical protein